MPYQIKKVERFYVVDNKGKRLSKEPLTRTKARKQLIAVQISKGNVPNLKPR